jgi:Cd2+/Zn2+-exporting ATPase
LSRKAVRIIKQNITFSLLIKAAFIIATLSGYATLWMAVCADTGTSLLVTLNGMRLMRVEDKG